MNIEEYRTHCMRKPGVTESFPFDNNTLVFKVMGKLFALCDVDEFISINLKCDPMKAIALREHYHGVKPGYHMNKKHWNTVEVNSDVPDDKLLEWIDDSYTLVVSKLTKKLKAQLAEMS